MSVKADVVVIGAGFAGVATAYHLVLARDPYFREIVTDDLFTGSGFSHGNLQKGVYHWKVSAMQDTIEGFFSRNGSFEVIQDQTPPKLQVQFPPSIIYQDRYKLHGRTSPGARVFIGGRRIKIFETSTESAMLQTTAVCPSTHFANSSCSSSARAFFTIVFLYT